jgi:hypothetical protein
VINVLRRDFGPDLRDAELLELEHHHRAGRVLRERLVDPQRDLAARGQLALEQVRSDQLVSDAATHRTRSHPLARTCGRVGGRSALKPTSSTRSSITHACPGTTSS